MSFKALIGKTIRTATPMKRPGLDDRAWLRLVFEDGTECVLAASYGTYTGESEDEYPAFLSIMKRLPSDLEPDPEQ